MLARGLGLDELEDELAAGANVLVVGTGIFRHPRGIAEAVAQTGRVVAMFSLEMTAEQLAERAVGAVHRGAEIKAHQPAPAGLRRGRDRGFHQLPSPYGGNRASYGRGS